LPQIEKLDRGEFHGPTDDVAAVINHSDLFFHTADREAHSVALLEAASVGLPIVCSEAVAATLPAGLPFGRFETGDVDSAVQALMRASREWDDAVRHAVQARDFVRSAYSMRKCADAYLELLERPVTTRRAGGR
jgi:glycosyltransferase involved in cell wall biosynthesis